MRFHYFLFGLIGLWMGCLGAQPPAEDTLVSYIYIGKSQQMPRQLQQPARVEVAERVRVQYPMGKEHTDYRELHLYRIPLFHPVNAGLTRALPEDNLYGNKSHIKGVIDCIWEGIKLGKLHAVMPKQPEFACTFAEMETDLRHYTHQEVATADTATLETGLSEFGITTTPQAQQPQQEMDKQGLYQFLDLVVESGYSHKSANSYLKIHFVQLVWYTPSNRLAPKIVAFVPYPEIEEYFRALKIYNPYNESQSINVHEYLLSGNFHAFVLKLME